MVKILVDGDPTSDNCPFSYLNDDTQWECGLPFAQMANKLCCCEEGRECPYLKVQNEMR